MSHSLYTPLCRHVVRALFIRLPALFRTLTDDLDLSHGFRQDLRLLAMMQTDDDDARSCLSLQSCNV